MGVLPLETDAMLSGTMLLQAAESPSDVVLVNASAALVAADLVDEVALFRSSKVVGADGVARLRFQAFRQHGGFVAREGGAFVELAVHLALELAHGPAAAQSLGVVKGEGFGRAGAADQQNVVRPGQREGAGKVGEGQR